MVLMFMELTNVPHFFIEKQVLKKYRLVISIKSQTVIR